MMIQFSEVRQDSYTLLSFYLSINCKIIRIIPAEILTRFFCKELVSVPYFGTVSD